MQETDILVLDNNDMEPEIEDTLQVGYELPANCSWKVLNIVNGKKEGQAKVMNRRKIVAVLEYHNDMLNGLCEFYDGGIVKKKIHYVDNVANGWGCEYDDDGNYSMCFYEHGRKKRELKKNNKREGYWDEIDLCCRQIVSRSQFNESHQQNGVTYLYENGQIRKISIYEDGKEIACLKEFKNGLMREFDKDGIIVYEGDCLMSFEKDYPREGYGEELKGDTILLYEGEWKNGKKNGEGKSYIDGVVYYDGKWKNDLPDGEGKLYENGEVKHRGDNWVRGKLELHNGKVVEFGKGVKVKVVVKSESDFNNLNKEVTELVIDEDVCNDIEGDIVIDGFNCVKSILVKKNSMKNLNSLKICNCKMLEKIETEASRYDGRYFNAAFEKVKSVEISRIINWICSIRSSSVNNIQNRSIVIQKHTIIEFNWFD